MIPGQSMQHNHISLYEAKTHLSSLVDRAAAGEEIIIAKNGTPRAKLIALRPVGTEPRRPAGALKVTAIAADFDAPDRDVMASFEGNN
jgi:prevent-host-death family protein